MSPDASTGAIDRLLRAVQFRGARGASDVAADSSPIDVVKEIVNARGIPILAHVDAENSAFNTPGNTLAELLRAPGLHAIEVRSPSWTPPELYSQQGLSWARVLGSNSHQLAGTPGQRFPGSHFTWVKMESPTHSGLRLALSDSDDSDDDGGAIQRSDLTAVDPNRYTHGMIERVTITDARYCGRSSTPGGKPLEVPFSPWLTTIIGGRGSGKSTVIELMRLALRREDELPATLQRDSEGFRKVPAGRDDQGALLKETEIGVVFCKDGHRYRIRWAAAGAVPAIEEERDGAWIPSAGEVRQRFPVRIFSQGQIFELARDHRALLRILGIPRDRLDLVETFVRDTCQDSIKPPLVATIIRMLLPASDGTDRAVIKIDVPRSLFVHKSPGGYFHRLGSSRRELPTELLMRLGQQRSQSRIIRFDEQVVPDTMKAHDDRARAGVRGPRGRPPRHAGIRGRSASRPIAGSAGTTAPAPIGSRLASWRTGG
jgi:hypothetical protein